MSVIASVDYTNSDKGMGCSGQVDGAPLSSSGKVRTCTQHVDELVRRQVVLLVYVDESEELGQATHHSFLTPTFAQHLFNLCARHHHNKADAAAKQSSSQQLCI